MKKLNKTHTQTNRPVKIKIWNKFMTWFYYLSSRFNNSIYNRMVRAVNLLNSYYKLVLNLLYKEKVAQYSFILPLILSKIDYEGHKNAEFLPVGHSYYVAMFLLSFVALSCFFSAIGYFFSMYLLQRYNIKEKYPKLNKILKYYEKTGFIMVILDCIFCIVALLVICITSCILAFGPMFFKFL
jgi:hypothetical protein